MEACGGFFPMGSLSLSLSSMAEMLEETESLRSCLTEASGVEWALVMAVCVC